MRNDFEFIKNNSGSYNRLDWKLKGKVLIKQFESSKTTFSGFKIVSKGGVNNYIKFKPYKDDKLHGTVVLLDSLGISSRHNYYEGVQYEIDCDGKVYTLNNIMEDLNFYLSDWESFIA